MRKIFLLIIFALTGTLCGQIPSDCTQLMLAVARTWDSSSGWMQRFNKTSEGWHPIGAPIPVLFGKNGLAWGRGIAGQDETGLRKYEKDKRAPAGIFRIGKIYTSDTHLPSGANYPFHTVTQADAWIDDPSLPEYNRHIIVDLKNPPPWFSRQKMRHGDDAYRWRIEIRHNADPPLSGEGSAIFFHIRRGANRPSAGCTTMAESDLADIVRWLREDAHPCYVLLPEEEYFAKQKSWKLPPRMAAANLLH